MGFFPMSSIPSPQHLNSGMTFIPIPASGTMLIPHLPKRHLTPVTAGGLETETESYLVRLTNESCSWETLYLEGYGINEEKRGQIKHLNFGSSGNFGSIQEWLIYKHLGSRLDHSDVFIFCLPANDFSDGGFNS